MSYLVQQYEDYNNNCRSHSRRGRLPPYPDRPQCNDREGDIVCESHLSGLLDHPYREAA
ncbi:MAG: hypothetical protein V3T53_04750 [Phycisphaerales bacterium]